MVQLPVAGLWWEVKPMSVCLTALQVHKGEHHEGKHEE